MPIPVVDLFAGPGGLSEGFDQYRYRGSKVFASVLAIEKDTSAHRTLLLRTFLRQFRTPPKEYYHYLQQKITLPELFASHGNQYRAALRIAVKLTLSRRNSKRAQRLVRRALPQAATKWVLLGGPPCQAYSLVGRARMKAKTSPDFHNDGRHFLYQEYLRILKTFRPPIFVMENVKGILSSAARGVEIFKRILNDFADAGYTVHSFVKCENRTELRPTDYIIKCEDHDIPQARHRVILLGVRKDLSRGSYVLRRKRTTVSTKAAIEDLPRIRSRVSPPSADSYEAWQGELRRLESVFRDDGRLRHTSPSTGRLKELKSGARYLNCKYPNGARSAWLRTHHGWFIDERLKGVTLHESRHHMPTDLRRYLFAAHYAMVHGVSPRLSKFPRWQRPKHENAKRVKDAPFSDRFRVQVKNKPASTVVSHISKDGHYYIHYDPVQCRSLTVREAARLQTFPDNYFFEGTRTDQYHQVGNAVPPLLALQLARVVSDILRQLR